MKRVWNIGLSALVGMVLSMVMGVGYGIGQEGAVVSKGGNVGSGASAGLGMLVDQTEFRDVAGELRCPTCTGLSVLDSEAKFSVQIKDEVKKQLEEGKSKDEILAFFSERYGPWILRSPPKEGVNVLVWAIPIALLILGPLLVFLFVWRRQPVGEKFGQRTSEEIIEEMHRAVDEFKKGAKA